MNGEFLDALRQIEREKDIPFDVLLDTIESALVSAYKKNYGVAGDVRVDIDSEESEFRVYCQKEVVETVENDHSEMSLEEAQTYDAEAQVGDVLEIEVTPENFTRIAAQTAKQVVMQHLREVERERTYEEYADKVGEVVTGTVLRREGKSVFVNIGKVEAMIPPSEQVPTEPYRFNERLKVYIVEVRRTPRGPQVIASRTHPRIVRRLFELEVPEIADEIVQIKAIAREPGQRTKVAVWSTDNRVDPVGACVGHRGSRVQAVVDELYNEKIDIIRWNESTAVFIGEALSPAKVIDVRLDEPVQSALVIVADSQLSLAIGKAGQNVRLAAKLTGCRIDIRSETQIAEMAAAEAAKAEAAKAEAAKAAAAEEQPAEAGESAEQAAAAEGATEEGTDEAVSESHAEEGADEVAAEPEPEPEQALAPEEDAPSVPTDEDASEALAAVTVPAEDASGPDGEELEGAQGQA
jgi:N utilization substance protein A